MTVTATYMDDLSRIRITYSGFSTSADYALVERSVDGINWTQVRGGDKAPMTSGAGHLDDYEFSDGVLNTYRVSAVDTGPITGVPAPGAAVKANNAAVTPPLPVGWVEGDLLLLFAVARKTGFSPTLVPPAGWTTLHNFGDFIFYGKRAGASETAPTVGITGGASGVDVVAQVMAYHNANLPQLSNTITGGSGQNVALPAIISPPAGTLNMWLAKKDSAWTSAVASSPFATIGNTPSALGSGVSMFWEYTVQAPTNPVTVLTRTLTVTGGAAAANVGIAYTFSKAPFLTRQTATITPHLTKVWLKNPSRPSLNTPVEIVSNSSITRASRSGVFDVKGRSLPVSVSDKQGPRVFTIGIDVYGFENIADADLRLAAGEPLFLQVPADGHLSFIPTCYVKLGDIELSQDADNSDSMTYNLPMTEVAKPGATVYGDTYIWADVVSDYATWADVLATVPTWSDLIDKIGTSEVIVD